MNALAVRRARLSLGVLAVVWMIAQLGLVGVHRYFGWDEAIYFAKASTSVPTVAWGPARALGMPALLSPVEALGGGLVAVRVEMLVLGTVGLVAAYWPWATRIGRGTPAAALLLASSWPALYFGTSLYPNLVVAIALVGALGATAESISKPRSAMFSAAFVFMAVATITRPTDALLAFVGAAPLLMVLRRRAAFAPSLALAGGLAVGCVVWIVEAIVAFGGPITRFRLAFAHPSGRDPRRGVLTGLAHAPIGSALSTTPVEAALAWAAAFVVLAVAGCALARRRDEFAGLIGAVAAAAALLVAYVVYSPDTGARFLLPVFALGSVPGGVAVDAAVKALRRPVRAVGRLSALVLASLAVAVVVHGHAANTFAKSEQMVGARDRATGRALALLAHGRPCAFVSQFEFPPIELASKCDGAPLRFDQSAFVPRSFMRQPVVRFAVGPNAPAAGSPVARWRRVVPADARTFAVYLAPSRPAAR